MTRNNENLLGPGYGQVNDKYLELLGIASRTTTKEDSLATDDPEEEAVVQTVVNNPEKRGGVNHEYGRAWGNKDPDRPS